MRKIKFELLEHSRAGKVFLVIEYAGGDADTEHPEEEELEGFTIENINDKLDELNNILEPYKILKKILDVNSVEHCEKYEEVFEKYGEDIANMYENVPNDPQCNYQFKCYLDRMSLIGYDMNSNKYESYF